ncbi:MAG: [protein-PII] uridylyltransferase [Verrucomicrobia bacterium]|nr:[protein-PII] uridylyltransferase [Verrucomicrobiota bacterium]
MDDLADQIRSDAAARLELPPGAAPGDELDRFRKFLQRHTQRLRMAHRHGMDGREVCRLRSEVIDQLLTWLVVAIGRHAKAAGISSPLRWTLVALGGYGRRELNPHSDIDVMLLVEGARLDERNLPPEVRLFTDALIFQFDLKVGNCVRAIADCVNEANANIQTKTSLLEARPICGDDQLFEQMRKTVHARCLRGRTDAYIEARVADQAARRSRYGDAVAMQEPNIKNGCGGLRDYQNLVWMTLVKYGTRDLGELAAKGLIQPEERVHLDAAYTHLLRVRTELHYLLDRPADVLLRAHQPAVAAGLGFHDRSLARRVERFMGEYYAHTAAIYRVTRTVEERLKLLPERFSFSGFLRNRRHRAAYVLDGFRFVDGQVHAATDDVFEKDPTRLMRVFRIAQQRGLGISAPVRGMITARLRQVDARFRADARVRASFLEILGHRGRVAPYLREMHELGLLGRYLPCFGKMTHLVQHEFYHVYAADAHTMACLAQLDRLHEGDDPASGFYRDLFARVQRPEWLYLALLLHDVGKTVRSASHAQRGARMARAVTRQLGLDNAATGLVTFLIEQHLTMAYVSQHRNLDDPEEIRRFAALVGDFERLTLLTLHSYADAKGTSEQFWTGHKDALLRELYTLAHRVLSGRAITSVGDAQEREELARAVRQQVGPEVPDAEVAAHFDGCPPRYFTLRSPDDIAADLRLIHQYLVTTVQEGDDPRAAAVAWQHVPDHGYSVLKVATLDRPAIFSDLTGILTAARLNILGAEIFTRSDGLALDSFVVTDAAARLPAKEAQTRRVETWLREVLVEGRNVNELLGALTPSAVGTGLPDLKLPTRIRFDNAATPEQTVIEVETEDRLGLLHTLVRVLAELELDVALAKITTDCGAAIDTFYVTLPRGQRLLGRDEQRRVEQRLRQELKNLR